jgi:hypothetical protein
MFFLSAVLQLANAIYVMVMEYWAKCEIYYLFCGVVNAINMVGGVGS